MNKKRLQMLAAKLSATYAKAFGIRHLSFKDLSETARAAWLEIAKSATRELTNNPKPVRRRSAKPNMCKFNAHGKWECR